MNVIQTVRKPYLAFFMASLILFVSCNQYENVNDGILDRQTVEALEKATLEFLENPNNFASKNKIDKNESYVDDLLKEAINRYASDDLKTFKQNVLNHSNWNYEQLASIEASFIVMTTVKDNYYNSNTSKHLGKKAAWWAPIGFAAICAVVGILSVGIAGAACGIMFATLQSLNNRT